MLDVQAVELGAGSGQHDQRVRSHTMAVGKLEEGQPRTGVTDQLQKTEIQQDWGRGGYDQQEKETNDWHRSTARL